MCAGEGAAAADWLLQPYRAKLLNSNAGLQSSAKLCTHTHTRNTCWHIHGHQSPLSSAVVAAEDCVKQRVFVVMCFSVSSCVFMSVCRILFCFLRYPHCLSAFLQR